jgi:ubiquinone biosynthesis protein COQ9
MQRRREVALIMMSWHDAVMDFNWFTAIVILLFAYLSNLAISVKDGKRYNKEFTYIKEMLYQVEKLEEKIETMTMFLTRKN